MIAATSIDTAQAAQISDRRDRREKAAVQPVLPPGRALATQRDALLFRSEAILRQGGPAPAPYLAQQIGQLWPSPPPAVTKWAMHAYHRTGAAGETEAHRASILV